jgi:hypothetical protein
MLQMIWISRVKSFREAKKDDDGAEANERRGNVIHDTPRVVNGDESIDNETKGNTKRKETRVYSVVRFAYREKYAITEPRSCKNQMSEIVKGARHSPEPAMKPKTIRAASSEPYDLATPAQIEHTV